MAIWQLPSGVYYDDQTNQIVPAPGGSSTATPAPATQAPNFIPMSGGYYNNTAPPPAANPAATSTPSTPSSPGNPGAIPMSGSYTNTPPAAPVAPQAPGAPTGTPYFMGDSALVKFANSPQTWLLDTKTRTLRPFISDQALAAVYGNNMQAIQAATQIITPDMLAPGGLLGGYETLPAQYAIKEDGNAPTWTGTLSSQLQARYGYPTNDNALEQDSHMLLGGFMNMLLTEPTGGIAQSTINQINADPNAISFYISALAYGGYTLEDIYRDVKRRELISQGRTDLENSQPISASQTRKAYQMTESGKAAQTSAITAPPAQLGTLDAKAMKLSIYDIPEEAFKTLVPIQDPGSDEFKANMDKILTPFFDIMMQQLTAQTEQEKALADYSWGEAKKEIERQLGIQLSNNALEAWGQIETAYDQFASQGIQGSGLQNEKIDDYLRRVRAQDQNNRDASANTEKSKDMAFYTGFATAQQIKDLVASDPAKAQAWGLVPSAEILASLDPATLKAKYPNLSDADIQRYRSSLLDENGNYRSGLFQKYMTGGNTNADAPNVQYIKDANGNVVGVNVSPTDTGKMDIQAAIDRQKSEQVLINSMGDETKAYAEFTKPDNPFLRAPATASQVTSANPGKPATQYTNLSGLLSGALQNVAPPAGQAPAPQSTTQQNQPPEKPAITPEIPTNYTSPTKSFSGLGTGTVQAPVAAPAPAGSGRTAITNTFNVPQAPQSSTPSPINFNSLKMTSPQTLTSTKGKTLTNTPTSVGGFSTTGGVTTPSTAGSQKGLWGSLKSLFGY